MSPLRVVSNESHTRSLVQHVSNWSGQRWRWFARHATAIAQAVRCAFHPRTTMHWYSHCFTSIKVHKPFVQPSLHTLRYVPQLQFLHFPVLMPTIHWYQSYARMFGNELAWYGTQLATLHSRACLSPRELTHVRFIKGVHHLGQHVGRCMGQVGQERVDSLDTQL